MLIVPFLVLLIVTLTIRRREARRVQQLMRDAEQGTDNPIGAWSRDLRCFWYARTDTFLNRQKAPRSPAEEQSGGQSTDHREATANESRARDHVAVDWRHDLVLRAAVHGGILVLIPRHWIVSAICKDRATVIY